jgi:hypothetical protein
MAAIAIVAFFMVRLRASARRRNEQSWESLLSRLRLDWRVRVLSDNHPLWKEGLSTTPQDAWQRMEGPKGLCVMFQNAGVMLEMADYAARNSGPADLELIAALRSDAMQIRLYIALSLGQYTFSQVNESICVNAFRAASMYKDMTARMGQLLQAHASPLVPEFVAAM